MLYPQVKLRRSGRPRSSCGARPRALSLARAMLSARAALWTTARSPRYARTVFLKRARVEPHINVSGASRVSLVGAHKRMDQTTIAPV